MTMDPATTASVERQGRMYYFCRKGCGASFTAHPDHDANAALAW